MGLRCRDRIETVSEGESVIGVKRSKVRGEAEARDFIAHGRASERRGQCVTHGAVVTA